MMQEYTFSIPRSFLKMENGKHGFSIIGIQELYGLDRSHLLWQVKGKDSLDSNKVIVDKRSYRLFVIYCHCVRHIKDKRE